MLKYLKEMLAKENRGKYFVEQLNLQSVGFFSLCFLGFSFLIFSKLGRILLFIISSLIVLALGLGALGALWVTINDVLKDYKRYKKRIDDEKLAELMRKRAYKNKVYFYDITALVCRSGALYGCYVVDNFDVKYLDLEEGAKVMTSNIILNQLMAKEQAGENQIYSGYTSFIKRHFKTLDLNTENINMSLWDEHGNLCNLSTDSYSEHNYLIATLLKYAEEMDTEIILVSGSPELLKLARMNNFKCVCP